MKHAEPPGTTRWVVDAPPDDSWPGRNEASASGTVAAYLALWPFHARQFRMDLVIDPKWQRRGLGSALLDFLIAEAREVDATSLQARPYFDHVNAIRLLDSRGFQETMRMVGLELNDVAAVDVPPLSELAASLEVRGIRITTLAEELGADASSWAKLRDANRDARFGWPEPDPTPDGRAPEVESVEEFQARAVRFGMVPEPCFIAATRDRFVGYSALTITDETRTQAGSGGTAVVPEYRGLGIATALKACCLRWARENGVRRLVTSSGNPAMIRVNEKFGFRRTYVEVRTAKRFWAESMGSGAR